MCSELSEFDVFESSTLSKAIDKGRESMRLMGNVATGCGRRLSLKHFSLLQNGVSQLKVAQAC